jgi:hypothetical protein
VGGAGGQGRTVAERGQVAPGSAAVAEGGRGRGPVGLSSALVVVVLLGACSSSSPLAATNRHRNIPSHATTTTDPTTTTTTTTTTLPPTTTTTIPPTTTVPPTTTTTTVPSAPVPDAATPGRLEGGSWASIGVLSRAGFGYYLVKVSEQSCYMLALPGQAPEWDGGSVVDQYPPAGTVEPLGSTVRIDICGPPPPTYQPPIF